MQRVSIIKINNLDKEIQTAINRSVRIFDKVNQSGELWLKQILKVNVEQAIKKVMNSAVSPMGSSKISGPGDPPPSTMAGFACYLGLDLSFDVNFKPRVKLSGGAGYGFRSDNFAASVGAQLALSNSGLGNTAYGNEMVVDVTAYGYLTMGKEKGTPMKSFTVNRFNQIANNNDFKTSFSYGQAFTYNSNLHKEKFSLDQIQREGVVGARFLNINISSNNDALVYGGCGTDKGYTGGIHIEMPFGAFGYNNFTGDYNHKGVKENKLTELREKKKKLKKEKKKLEEKAKSTRNKDLQEIIAEIKVIEADIAKNEAEQKLLANDEKSNGVYHTQDDRQKSLNKASTYFQWYKEANTYTLDLFNVPWFQNFLHDGIPQFKFDTPHVNYKVFIGHKFVGHTIQTD